MLSRDFIHDSLYNSSYGYFSKKAYVHGFIQDPCSKKADIFIFLDHTHHVDRNVDHRHIFSPPKDIPFNEIRDNYAFMNYLADLYKDIESESLADVDESARQVWHTPTELFRVSFPVSTCWVWFLERHGGKEEQPSHDVC
jgi:hypothetical protein